MKSANRSGLFRGGKRNLLGVDDAVHHGLESEARDAFDAEFGGDVLAVGEDGIDADVEGVGNLLVDHAARHKAQYFNLTPRQHIGLIVIFLLTQETAQSSSHHVSILLGVYQVDISVALNGAVNNDQRPCLAGQEYLQVLKEKLRIGHDKVYGVGGQLKQLTDVACQMRRDAKRAEDVALNPRRLDSVVQEYNYLSCHRLCI